MDQVPKEAKIITMLLSTLSVPECEPRIISFLMEFMFSILAIFYNYIGYSTEVFKEALALSEHAKKSTISKEELKLAVSINSRILHSKILSRAVILYNNYCSFLVPC